MLKQYKKTLIITNLLTILPILVGIILWDRLPNEVATHFGTDGTPNGWSSKIFAVFGMPLFLLAMDWVCIGATMFDPKKKNIGTKMFTLILWIIPMISIFVHFAIYSVALGAEFNIGKASCILMGVIFILVGNYLPKSKQSYTVGIKLPWTYNSQENWNRTHRLGGWVWIICGVIFLFNAFFLIEWLLLAVLAAAVLVPTVYSFVLYKKGI